MKKVIKFFQNWFEKNGLIKILAAFLILILSAVIVRNTHSNFLEDVFGVIGIASAIYLALTCLIFTIAGIVNAIKDVINRKK